MQFSDNEILDVRGKRLTSSLSMKFLPREQGFSTDGFWPDIKERLKEEGASSSAELPSKRRITRSQSRYVQKRSVRAISSTKIVGNFSGAKAGADGDPRAKLKENIFIKFMADVWLG